MHTHSDSNSLTKTSIIVRGCLERCPKCGEGKLFKSYLKQNDACPVCGEDFSRFRADDGPAWLTILITGHIILPFAIYWSMHDVMPQWLALLLLLAMTLLCVFLLLPRSKGFFISVLWLLARKKIEKAA
jgi:uncharacterized protein (DUF983 family)